MSRWMPGCAVFHWVSAQASPDAGGQEVNYHRDDGTFSSGLIVAALIVLAFISGYWVRDKGFIIRVQTPPVQSRANSL
ncbi:hypothetical protein [Phormidesmis priestleyi]|nr:hypothetical protein [Phormidesmis priestleyi]